MKLLFAFKCGSMESSYSELAHSDHMQRASIDQPSFRTIDTAIKYSPRVEMDKRYNQRCSFKNLADYVAHLSLKVY